MFNQQAILLDVCMESSKAALMKNSKLSECTWYWLCRFTPSKSLWTVFWSKRGTHLILFTSRTRRCEPKRWDIIMSGSERSGAENNQKPVWNTKRSFVLAWDCCWAEAVAVFYSRPGVALKELSAPGFVKTWCSWSLMLHMLREDGGNIILKMYIDIIYRLAGKWDLMSVKKNNCHVNMKQNLPMPNNG